MIQIKNVNGDGGSRKSRGCTGGCKTEVMTIGTKEAMAGGVQDSIDQVTFEIDLLTSFQSISAFEIWIVDN